MSESKYLKFPLAALGHDPTPLLCMERALNCAVMNAGIGTRKTKYDEIYILVLERLCGTHDIDLDLEKHPHECDALVGVSVLGLTNCYNKRTLKSIVAEAKEVSPGAFVTIKSDFFWSALTRLRREDNCQSYDAGALSWRELRVLCAVYSIKPNSRGFAYISAEAIRARAHGFLSVREMKNGIVPDSLIPRIMPKQIRLTLNSLEKMNFFARFRYSKGTKGGKMAYSIRLKRKKLAAAVMDWQSFSEGEIVDQWRKEDAKVCRQKRRDP